MSVRTSCGEPMSLLSFVKYFLRGRQKNKSTENEDIAQNMQRIEVRIYFPAEQRVPQVSCIMRKWIEPTMTSNQPAGDEIDRQRKAVHFDKESDNKRRKGAERAPIALRFRFRETERKNDKDRRIDDHQRPQTIRGRLFHLALLKGAVLNDDLCVHRPRRHDFHGHRETDALTDREEI